MAAPDVLKAHPSRHAAAAPSRPAAILAETGETLDYATLEARSNQIAHLFRRWGLVPGAGVAVLMDNGLRYFEAVWAIQRAGLYLTTLSNRLTLDEVAFIVGDSGASVLIVSPEFADMAEAIAVRLPGLRLLRLPDTGPAPFDDEPALPIADEFAGADMLYSSGTTGRPKGVRSPLPLGPIDAPSVLMQIAHGVYGVGPDTIYLSAGPLYHAAPLRWSMAVQALGGTVVVLRKFEAEAALSAIQTYRANISQWVPTHFVRMLKLPPQVREAYDVSSMRMALHAAAPCPVPVKQAMMDWWGPVLHEYYAGTENFGFTAIGPEEWLNKPGSVGRPLACEVRVCGEDGEPLPIGETGDVFFKSDVPVAEYHGDPAKTRESRNQHGWATYGDIGRLDEDGYLYLTDRRNFTIISGGVNIYPQEIENLLIGHPRVRDVAVIGAPDAEMGERVVAVIEPMRWSDAGDAFAAELIAFARETLSPIKIPRQIDFMVELPRQPTGKLFKRLIQARYQQGPPG
jgi:long-chain acyl-CoA synthetase